MAVLDDAVAVGLGETLPTDRRQTGGVAASLRAFRDLLTEYGFPGDQVPVW